MASASAAVLWTTVLCGILIVSGTLNPTAQGVRALDAPTKLSVVFENQYTAVLFWEFTEPKDTNLDDIEFSLSLFGEKGRLEEFKLKAGRRPFHHKFKYLTPNSEYSVKLWASSLELGSSPLTTMFFTTMEGDWPTPFLTNVSARRTQEAMQYTVSWALSSRPVELYHFDIVLCFLECETMRTRPSESHITFPISFYTEFSLNVTAVYNAGVGLKMKRTSSVYHSKSEMGPPSRVTNVTNILQKGNMFEIDWLPPDPPNGPLSYYEVLVYDPKDFDDASEVEVHSGTSATLLAPQLGGGVYKIQITAVNVDPHGVEYYSRKSVFSHERVLPSGSPRIRILDREWNYTHFRIIAEHPQEHLRFDVYSEKPTYGIFNRPDEYIIYGLNPFETFEMDVRTCYATRNLRIHTCAYFTHFNLTSNVKAPSEVRDLEIAFISKTRVSASWNPPLFPNGPNHGYLINATMGIEGVEDVTSQYNEGEPLLLHLPGHITQVEFEKPKEWRSITVGVSAVNHHLDDSTLEYVGEQVTKSLRKPGFRSKTQFFLTLAYFFLAFFLMSWAIYGMAVVLLEVTFSARPELNELDLIQGVPDAPRGNQLDVDLLQGVPDRQRDD